MPRSLGVSLQHGDLELPRPAIRRSLGMGVMICLLLASLTGLAWVAVAAHFLQPPSECLYACPRVPGLLGPILQPLLLHPGRPWLHPQTGRVAVKQRELRVVHIAAFQIPGLPAARLGHHSEQIPQGVGACRRGEAPPNPGTIPGGCAWRGRGRGVHASESGRWVGQNICEVMW